jgi:hypothetical protein
MPKGAFARDPILKMLAFRILLVALFLEFSDPQIPDGELSLYLATEKGIITPIERRITHSDSGYLTVHRDTSGLEVQSFVDCKTLKTIWVRKFRDGSLTLEERCDSIGVLVKDLAKNRARRFRHQGPVYDRHTLFEVFRGFPFAAGDREIFSLVVPEFRIIGAEAKLLGKERLKTPWGEEECYKLEMKPRGLIGFLARKYFHFWYSLKSPHHLVLYQDSDGREIRLQARPSYE